ncbi:MAG: hypothetical protein AMJ64_07645 [Betaproteobacteria bacterium SG8_39]|jgi:hypothetical protein|nr:MAG: hypothetical protein AMJ64_07645 [Betaproteobacteria bacterium SG8_39]
MMRRILAAVLLAAGAPVLACDSPGADYARLESPRFVLWMATRPAPVPIGSEFAIDAVLCAKGATSADAVGFDAWMPAHRHGMNSRPSVRALDGGRWRAEGYLFHMPGRWQFTFEIDTASGRERLTHDVELD